MKRVYVFTEYTSYTYEHEVRKWAVVADETLRWEIMRFGKELKPIKIEEINNVEEIKEKECDVFGICNICEASFDPSDPYSDICDKCVYKKG